MSASAGISGSAVRHDFKAVRSLEGPSFALAVIFMACNNE